MVDGEGEGKEGRQQEGRVEEGRGDKDGKGEEESVEMKMQCKQ